MKEFEDILSVAAYTSIAMLLVVAVVRIWYVLRTRHQRGSLRDVSRAASAVRVAGAIGLVLLGFGLVNYLFVLQRGSAFMPTALKTTLAALLVAWLAAEIAVRFWPQLPASRFTSVRSAVSAAAFLAAGILLLATAQAASTYPPDGSEPLLDPPFEGEWVAMGAGPTSRTNHHNRIPSQRFAIDLAKACADGRLFRGEGNTLDESCTFGATVLAPAAGVVTRAVDGLSDRDSRSELAGNHVIIRISEDRYVALAHLMHGSIAVEAGDTVGRGQRVGRAGNSGNSDFAHLHIHVQDSPVYDLRESVSIPFRFRNAEVKRYLFWRPVSRAALLSNDRIRPSRQ
jgi:hypothetical protein